MKSGGLILVTGFYGAGKSTLVHAALASIEGLEYLKTVTTRPPRLEEIEHGSLEYDFVSPEEYTTRQTSSKSWDHTPVGEHSYGADVDHINQTLVKGISVICCVVPDSDTIGQMSKLYATQPTLIWVSTPLEIANERLQASGDENRKKRIGHRLQSDANAANVKQLASGVFEPVNDIQIDVPNFIQMVQEIMYDSGTAGVL